MAIENWPWQVDVLRDLETALVDYNLLRSAEAIRAASDILVEEFQAQRELIARLTHQTSPFTAAELSAEHATQNVVILKEHQQAHGK